MPKTARNSAKTSMLMYCKLAHQREINMYQIFTFIHKYSFKNYPKIALPSASKIIDRNLVKSTRDQFSVEISDGAKKIPGLLVIFIKQTRSLKGGYAPTGDGKTLRVF